MNKIHSLFLTILFYNINSHVLLSSNVPTSLHEEIIPENRLSTTSQIHNHEENNDDEIMEAYISRTQRSESEQKI